MFVMLPADDLNFVCSRPPVGTTGVINLCAQSVG